MTITASMTTPTTTELPSTSTTSTMSIIINGAPSNLALARSSPAFG